MAFMDIRKRIPEALHTAFVAASKAAEMNETQYLIKVLKADPGIAEKLEGKKE